jgi:hypothetical protein
MLFANRTKRYQQKTDFFVGLWITDLSVFILRERALPKKGPSWILFRRIFSTLFSLYRPSSEITLRPDIPVFWIKLWAAVKNCRPLTQF